MESIATKQLLAEIEKWPRRFQATLPAWTGSALVRASALFAFATFLGLLFSTQIYLGMLSHGHDWWRLLVWQASTWWLWALYVPLVLWLARRFPLHRPIRLRRIALHFLAAIGLGSVHCLAVTPIYRWLEPYQPIADAGGFREEYLEFFQGWFHIEIIVYWGILGLVYSWHYYHRHREGKLRASQLEALLAKAELQALKLQLHPHFLFNALNAVSSLVRRQENDDAVKMLGGLGELLRYVLNNADRQLAPLENELSFIGRYLEIERLRFSDRLLVTVDVDPTTLTLQVPSLILQPLVENALEHGVASHSELAHSVVETRRIGDRLSLTVEDDGPGLDTNPPRAGIGLGITRSRLTELYHDDFDLTVEGRDHGGVIARILIPVRPPDLEDPA